MNRTGRTIAIIVAFGIFVVVAAGAYIWFSGGSGEASGEIESESVSAGSSATVFEIVPAESEARFIIDEDLRGARNTVTGVTDDVAGQIAVDFDNPANSELGTIRINVRTLQTDDEFRNRAIRGQILQSQQANFEFAEFVPTAITGLPTSVTMGESFEISVTGNLTLKGITNPVTFMTTINPVSETRIEGSAAAVVMRGDYGLNIPSVPGVANVEEEVELEIDFVATPVGAAGEPGSDMPSDVTDEAPVATEEAG